MEGVAGRIELLWGEGVCQRSGLVRVGVDEFWSDKGAMVQSGFVCCGCRRMDDAFKLHCLHALFHMGELAFIWIGGHAIILHGVSVQITWLG